MKIIRGSWLWMLPALLVLVDCMSCSSGAGTSKLSSSQRKILETFLEEFVEISPGREPFPATFLMGDAADPASAPVHEVTMNGPFYMARHEVPQNLYSLVMHRNPSRWVGPRNSAESMARKEVLAFCEQLTALLHREKLLPENEWIRLPTEAEWEYCCRAGSTTLYCFGDEAQAEGDEGLEATTLDQYAWHTGNAAGNDPAVGSLAPNAWGLYDMHGYLWEHCLDDWHHNYENAPATSWPAWTSGQSQQIVLRGGSWKEPYNRLRSATRRMESVTVGDDAIGFRCVRALRQP